MMKAVLLAGGFGTRLAEETTVTPKPMVEIGGKPIMWHIMKTYAHYGITDFVVLGGYKVDYIRSYFLNYQARNCDMVVNLGTGAVEWLSCATEDWRVTILDTGLDSMTGGRLRRARYLLQDGPFCLTYGDGVSDVDIPALVQQHKDSGAWCTLTAVSHPGRYGALRIDGGTQVQGFSEKGKSDGAMINGGFFVCSPEMLDLIDNDDTVLENEPMDRLIAAGRLGAYRHDGFWQSMDTLRDKHLLESLWQGGSPPWKVWHDTAPASITPLRRTA